MLCSPNESESVRNILWERQRAAVGWDVVSPNESELPPQRRPRLSICTFPSIFGKKMQRITRKTNVKSREEKQEQ